MAVRIENIHRAFADRAKLRPVVADFITRRLHAHFGLVDLLRRQIPGMMDAAAVGAKGLHLIDLDQHHPVARVERQRRVRATLIDKIAADHIETDEVVIKLLRPVEIRALDIVGD